MSVADGGSNLLRMACFEAGIRRHCSFSGYCAWVRFGLNRLTEAAKTPQSQLFPRALEKKLEIIIKFKT